jgi:hypothetical protein
MAQTKAHGTEHRGNNKLASQHFLKGVIGVVVGTQKPWTAQSPVYRNPSPTKKIAHQVRALHLKQNKLTKFKGVCVMESGQELIAPKVKHIKIQNTEFGHCILVAWEFEDIELKQPVKIVKLRIVDDLGFCVMDKIICPPIYGRPEDTIRLYDIQIGLD